MLRILAFLFALTIGVAHAQVTPGTSPLSIAKGGTNAATAAAARTNLGLVIGTNVEAWDSDLDCLAAISTTGVIHRTGSGACNAGSVALSDLVQSTAGAQFLGVTGASAATYAPFTLASLTALPSPNSTLDLIPCVDHTTGTIKSCTPAGIASSVTAGSVLLSGTVISKTAAYSAVTGDCGSTITLGGSAQYALTLNAASGYTANCGFMITNLASETRSKTIAINGLTSFFLYPGQTAIVSNQSNAWNVGPKIGRWRLTGTTTITIRPDGSDSNDGLANSSSGAFLTANAAFAAVSNNIDINGQTLNVQHTCGSPPCTITAVAQLLNLTNTKFTGGVPTYMGDCTTPSNVTLAPSSPVLIADIHISLGDLVFVCGFKLAGTPTNAPTGLYVSGGQELNITGPMQFDNVGTGLQVNAHAHVYVDGALNFSHSMTAGILVSRQSYLEPGQAETITLTGTPAWSTAFLQVIFGGVANVNGFTYSGSSTGNSALISYNSVVDSGGVACVGLTGNGTVTLNNGGLCF